MRIIYILLIFTTFSLCSCSSSNEPKIVYEKYYPTTRTSTPESVYGRITYSQLSKPIGTENANKQEYYRSQMLFELPNSNVEEALNAIAQSVGYEAVCSAKLANRPVSIELEGTSDDALEELSKQAKVAVVIDRELRTLTVVGRNSIPTLPTDSVTVK